MQLSLHMAPSLPTQPMASSQQPLHLQGKAIVAYSSDTSALDMKERVTLYTLTVHDFVPSDGSSRTLGIDCSHSLYSSQGTGA